LRPSEQGLDAKASTFSDNASRYIGVFCVNLDCSRQCNHDGRADGDSCEGCKGNPIGSQPSLLMLVADFIEAEFTAVIDVASRTEATLLDVGKAPLMHEPASKDRRLSHAAGGRQFQPIATSSTVTDDRPPVRRCLCGRSRQCDIVCQGLQQMSSDRAEFGEALRVGAERNLSSRVVPDVGLV